MFGQTPKADAAGETASQVGQVVAELQQIGWIDVTALTILGVFFVLGLFKGLLWQVSRIGILLAAYLAADGFGPELAVKLSDWWSSADDPDANFYLYLACVLIFVAILVALSLVALLLQKLIQRAGLSFYNRLFGGVLGVGTGAAVVLIALTGIYMFFPQSRIAAAAGDSYSLRFGRQVMDRFEPWLLPEISEVLPDAAAERPASNSPAGDSSPGSPGGDPNGDRSGEPSGQLPRQPGDLRSADPSGGR